MRNLHDTSVSLIVDDDIFFVFIGVFTYGQGNKLSKFDQSTNSQN